MSTTSTTSPTSAPRQVAIVTGASRGIGAAVARQLSQDGYAIVVNYSSNAAEAQKVVDAITAAKGEAIAVRADIADPKAVSAMFDEAIKAFGRVDVLVNNAGFMPTNAPTVADTDEATLDRLLNINIKGSFNTLREAATRLEHGGRIVNLSTSQVGLLFPGYSAYTATKAAIEAITSIMAKEMRGKRITVNAIAPGPTATDLFLNGKSAEVIERFAKAPPLERLGTPEDIASAIAFLVSPAGAWINGQTLRANGGVV